MAHLTKTQNKSNKLHTGSSGRAQISRLYPDFLFCLHHINPASLAKPLLLVYSWGRWSGSVSAFTKQMHVVHKHIVNKCGLDLDTETSHFTYWLEDMSYCTSELFSAPNFLSYWRPSNKKRQTRWRLFHG